MKNYVQILSVAVSAFALAASAQAKSLSSTGNGDLILGIYATGGTGSGNTLEVNLGEFTNYAKFDGSVFTVSELSVTDLNNFGSSGAFARSNVSWGVIGSVGTSTFTSTGTGLKTTKNTLFATSLGGSLNSGAINAQAGANPSIGGLYTSLISATAANNASSAYVSSDAFAWSGQQTGSAPLDFGFFTSSVTSTADVSSLALYEVLPTNATAGSFTETGITAADKGVPRLLGTFNLASTGVLTFTSSGSAPIPEPSTYAAIAGVAMLGLASFRRRRAVKA